MKRKGIRTGYDLRTHCGLGSKRIIFHGLSHSSLLKLYAIGIIALILDQCRCDF